LLETPEFGAVRDGSRSFGVFLHDFAILVDPLEFGLSNPAIALLSVDKQSLLEVVFESIGQSGAHLVEFLHSFDLGNKRAVDLLE
jgi:hypothetical protein